MSNSNQEFIPIYRNLGTTVVPTGYRQLANHERIRSCDAWAANNMPPYVLFDAIDGVGMLVKDTREEIIYFRKLEDDIPAERISMKETNLRSQIVLNIATKLLTESWAREPRYDSPRERVNVALDRADILYQEWRIRFPENSEENPESATPAKIEYEYKDLGTNTIFRDLGPHTVPKNCQQLTNDDKIKVGDLCINTNYSNDTWEPAERWEHEYKWIGISVKNTPPWVAFCRLVND